MAVKRRARDIRRGQPRRHNWRAMGPHELKSAQDSTPAALFDAAFEALVSEES
jgi:hypothetical protein